jgi:DnaJ family protein A protein 2
MFFEDFFSGGMPGGGQSMRREEVNTDELYETLGVEKNATQREIKKAWRKLARQHHPDRGGDPETYKNCEEAHSVLQDADVTFLIFLVETKKFFFSLLCNLFFFVS